MLNVDTRRRIDAARDVLVGKVPDPKSQVEQITIALIYKFMDDMDAENEEWGGNREFFAGEFEQYRWASLVRGGLGGHEMLNRYAEAITRMPENPRIPALFRSIFNNAFLPYRDPETLRLFLREIDGFEYSDSEALGDAFEYLLSVLGSQGDAGQFRTPRHIIDFIVNILDPKKDETVLDPACGTAGFLISAWKHILNANMDGEGNSTLTPDERERLARNFTGYDISPDMVRLSLVNMYLHGFANPRILEYDTLTSEDHWRYHADVVLANPPFMNPKGGIRPHKRFSVQSTRSEVLFVDYMAEHLTPSGRAGIIVPEGVIFQSQHAHTQLRKMLVENYLIAVISLPAGVFKPYSGVKTSILILDKALARRTDTVAFFKVENDGRELGDQRREIEANDLPAVQAEVGEYLRRLRAGEDLQGYEPEFGLIVTKSRIADDGNYNLSAERYRDREVRPTKWPIVRLADVCTINPSKSGISELPLEIQVSFVPMADLRENQIAFIPQQQKSLGEIGGSYTYFADDDVLLAKVTPCFENGKAGIAKNLTNGVGFGSSEFYVLRSSEAVLPELLYYCVTSPQFRQSGIDSMTGTGGLQRVPRQFVGGYQVPLPPLDVQREVVAEVEGYQRVVDGARAVLDGYRPHVPVDPSWPLVRLGKISSKPEYGSGASKTVYDGKVRYIRITDLTDAGELKQGDPVSPSFIEPTYFLEADDLLIARSGSVGRAYLHTELPGTYQYAGYLIRFRIDKSVALPKYVFNIMHSNSWSQWVQSNAKVGAQPNINAQQYSSFELPLPPLEVQHSIVAELQAEQALVEANRELITRMEARIEAAIGRVWGEG